MIYLDANATELLRPEARDAVIAALALPGNPASIHAAGRAARRLLDQARDGVAAAVGARPEQVIFTSGGTEANALALRALGRGRAVLRGATEHDAVRAAAPAAGVLPVTGDGRVDLAAMEATLAASEPALVCLMLANNETGVIHPIRAAAAICARHGAWLHVDAVQALGRIPVDLAALGADSLALSGHKLGGPKGAGALVLAGDIPPDPLIAGGGQERGWRGGTPSLPAIAGFAAAARVVAGLVAQGAQPDRRIAALRDRMEAAALAEGAVACGATAPRLPNTTCLALPGHGADTQLIALDLAGVQVSAGAACSSGKVARSHVLDAMGLGALAGQAIRVSLPWSAAETDADRFAIAYQTMSRRLRGRAA